MCISGDVQGVYGSHDEVLPFCKLTTRGSCDLTEPFPERLSDFRLTGHIVRKLGLNVFGEVRRKCIWTGIGQCENPDYQQGEQEEVA